MKTPQIPSFLLRVRLFAVVASFALVILLGKGFLTIHGQHSEDLARAAVVSPADLEGLSADDKKKIQEQLAAHGLSSDLSHIQDLPEMAKTKIAEALVSLKKSTPAEHVEKNAKTVSSLKETHADFQQKPDAGFGEQQEGFDPLRLTSHEVQVLETLAKRRDVLNQREREMHFKAALLTASEERINKKIEELRVLQKGVAELLKMYKTQDDENLKSLAKIYENMKPREAARILSDLEIPVLLKVITHMRELRSSAILANMETEKARDVTMALARDHKLMTETQAQLGNLRGSAAFSKDPAAASTPQALIGASADPSKLFLRGDHDIPSSAQHPQGPQALATGTHSNVALQALIAHTPVVAPPQAVAGALVMEGSALQSPSGAQ